MGDAVLADRVAEREDDVVLTPNLSEGRGPEASIKGLIRSVVRSLGHAG